MSSDQGHGNAEAPLDGNCEIDLEDISELIARAEAIIKENRTRMRQTLSGPPDESLRRRAEAALRDPSPNLIESTSQQQPDRPIESPPRSRPTIEITEAADEDDDDDVVYVNSEPRRAQHFVDLSTPINRVSRKRRQQANIVEEIINLDSPNPERSVKSATSDSEMISLPLSCQSSTSATNKLTITCPVCMDICRKPASTLCGHVFCSKCITEAVRICHKCPLCNHKLSKRMVHPIFL